MINTGDFPEDATVYIPINTSSISGGESVTITNFLNTDVHIHKNDGLIQRNNAAGITVSIDFDGITGNHLIKIDTGDDAVAGFWVKNADYFVRIEGTTIETKTVNVWVGMFSIENRAASKDLANATDGLGALKTLIDACSTHDAAAVKTAIEAAGSSIALILADTGELQTDLVNGGRLDLLIDAIKAKTDNLKDAWNDITAAAVKTAIEAAGSSIALILADTGELQTNQGNWLTATGFSTHNAAAVKTAIEAAGSSIALILADTGELQTDLVNGGRLDLLIDAIKAKTDNLPSGIAKNVALSNFEFLMIDSTDHVSAKTGLTVTAQISKDGGAFASCTNSVAEIGSGLYKIDLTQAEMNADIITLKFTSTGADQRTITITTS